jgi:hypothetical protein
MNSLAFAVNRTFERTLRLLWPVRSGVWLRLFFLLMLAGAGGFHSGLQKPLASLHSTTAEKKRLDPKTRASLGRVRAKWNNVKTIATDVWAHQRRLVLQVAALLGVILLLVIVLFTWLSSRMQLVLTAALMNEKVAIREYWRQTERLGESLFWLRAIIFALNIAFVAGSLTLLFKKWWPLPGAFGWATIKPLLLSGGLVFAAWAALGFVIFFIVRFLPIVMVRFNETAWPAVGRMLRFMLRSPLAALGSLAVYVVMSVVVSIALGIAIVLIGTALVLVGGILAALGVIVAKAGGIVVKAPLILIGAVLAVGVGSAIVMLATVPGGTVLTFLRIELVRQRTDPAETSALV